MEERHFPRWAETECDICCNTFQITQTNEKTLKAGEKAVCNDCEMYQRGYDDAEKQYKSEIEDLQETVAQYNSFNHLDITKQALKVEYYELGKDQEKNKDKMNQICSVIEILES